MGQKSKKQLWSHLPCQIAAIARHQRLELDGGECRDENGLAEVRREAVQVPLADARDVSVVLALRDLVHVLQQVLDVRPVLHQERLALLE